MMLTSCFQENVLTYHDELDESQKVFYYMSAKSYKLLNFTF